jgi:hypothetical protein
VAAEIDERFDRLVLTLTQLAELLRDVGDDWGDSVDRCRSLIERGNASGLVAFLGTFGGMGSFNDVVISPVNGHHVAPSQIGSVNAEFQRLKSQAWADATALKRDLDQS